MLTALDRLLARPSALRVLRNLIADEQFPAAVFSTPPCQWPRRLERRSHSAAAAPSRGRREKKDESRQSIRKEASEYVHHSAQAPERPTEAERPPTTQSELEDFSIWIARFQFRRRVFGSDGARETWKEMRKKGVELPLVGDQARALWEMLLDEEGLLEEVVSYAENVMAWTGQAYPALYESIIGRFFARRKHPDVYRWHNRLTPTFPPQDGALRRLAAKSTCSKAALDAFSWIYTRSNQRDVYDALITSLCNKGMHSTALRWHLWLIKRGDFPLKVIRNMPVDEDLRRHTDVLSFLEFRKAKGARYSGASASEEPDGTNNTPLNREAMNRILGHVHSVEPKQLDDHFCARIFATKAFSIDVVINGLSMFGIDTIGPLALREMASRADSCQELMNTLDKLKQAGITVNPSVFSRAVCKFAETNRMDLLHGLLCSDQHPDLFEDLKLQRGLLASYVARDQWPDVYRTLAILTVFYSDPSAEQWNILLRTMAMQQDVPKLIRVLEDMHFHRIPLSEASQSALQRHWLRNRRRGKAPSSHHNTADRQHDDTTLVTKVFLVTLQLGGDVNPRRWAEIFRRYGMTYRFDEVVKLALWLAMWYMPREQANFNPALSAILQHPRVIKLEAKDSGDAPPVWIPADAVPPTHPAHPLRRIFSPVQQAAFIAWGFRIGFRHPQSRKIKANLTIGHTWSRGIRLLKQLRDRGVYVPSQLVRKQLKIRLLILFGRHHRGSKIKSNRRARVNNTYTLKAMVDRANEIWGRPLLRLKNDKKHAPTLHVKWSKEGLKNAIHMTPH